MWRGLPAGVLSVLVLLCASASPIPVEAANRIFLSNQTVKIGETGVPIPVRGETDGERHGFSLSIKFDPSKLVVKSLNFAGTVAADAEWSFGSIPAGQGKLQWGVVLDKEAPLDKVIPAGNNLILANLIVDVTAAAPGTTQVTPENNLGTPPGGWTNIYSQKNVTIVPTLAGGTITIDPLPPVGNKYLLADCSGDGILDLTDAVFSLNYQFLAGPTPGCLKSCNANSDPFLDLTDAVFVLNYLFLAGETPGGVFPACDIGPVAECAVQTCPN